MHGSNLQLWGFHFSYKTWHILKHIARVTSIKHNLLISEEYMPICNVCTLFIMPAFTSPKFHVLYTSFSKAHNLLTYLLCVCNPYYSYAAFNNVRICCRSSAATQESIPFAERLESWLYVVVCNIFPSDFKRPILVCWGIHRASKAVKFPFFTYPSIVCGIYI